VAIFFWASFAFQGEDPKKVQKIISMQMIQSEYEKP
jgi:hypothetical protein